MTKFLFGPSPLENTVELDALHGDGSTERLRVRLFDGLGAFTLFCVVSCWVWYLALLWHHG